MLLDLPTTERNDLVISDPVLEPPPRGDQHPAVTLAPLTRTAVVGYREGLHLRKCMAVVEAAGRHQARVTVQKLGQIEEASSIWGLLSLAAIAGTELLLSATGPDAQQALEAVALICAGDERAGAP